MLIHLPEGHGDFAVRDGPPTAIKTLPAHLRKTLTRAPSWPSTARSPWPRRWPSTSATRTAPGSGAPTKTLWLAAPVFPDLYWISGIVVGLQFVACRRTPAGLTRVLSAAYRRPSHRAHRQSCPVPQLSLVRQLRRRSTDRSRQRRQSPPPPLPRRRPPAQRRAAHRRDHPDPDTGQPRAHLLHGQDHPGQNGPRGTTVPEATARRPHLAHHDHRRTTHGGEPGRTLGDDSEIQRGWLNPDHQLFGQVTFRARQTRRYDASSSRLTNCETSRAAWWSLAGWLCGAE